jgi:hypothetical protein
MVNARAATNDAVIIFLMVDDPPESPLKYTQASAWTGLQTKKFRNQNG